MEDCPNVVIIPSNRETPEEIVEDYVAMIHYNLDRGIPLEEVLYMFFEDVNRWSCRELLIDQTKENLRQLEIIQEEEIAEMLDVDDDFEEEF
ncbi:hypothetical protein [Cytobacillus gottheilii]|uniref:hypothetical protein n=1 Tax=Cytobacillus gottheilii TaxID=859144 RepID=UPI0009BA87A3|nr:hypothetical protein [Cytobacillus gottheilii]